MVNEIQIQKDFLSTKKLETIYFGGGTPSILTQNELSQIFNALHKVYDFTNSEITLEANPEDLMPSKLEEIKSLGINRLSIGTQSFDDNILKFFNRSHNAEEAKNSIKNAQKIGINNISIDLIYGVPNQTLEDFKIEIEKALELNTEHISAYCLTIEPNTVFGRRYEQNKFPLIDEGIAAEQFELLIEMLKTSGFDHYEISNFAKTEMKSKHNSNYWFGSEYLGIGPGAHSYDGNNRYYNVSNNTKYIKSLQNNTLPNTIEILSNEQKFNEFVLTRIRTSVGIDLKELNQKYKLNLLELSQNKIGLYLDQKLISMDDNYLKLSEKGKLFADKITEDLMI